MSPSFSSLFASFILFEFLKLICLFLFFLLSLYAEIWIAQKTISNAANKTQKTILYIANSILLSETVRKIVKAFDLDLLGLCENGRLLSADNAHAVHPNHPEYADPKNAPKLNGGVVIKYNANQKYVTNAQSGAEFRIVCDNAGVKYQLYANRSDIPGGSTLGSISSTQLPLSGIDIGAPQLAMHSCFETAGTGDTYEIMNATKAFLEN